MYVILVQSTVTSTTVYCTLVPSNVPRACEVVWKRSVNMALQYPST